MFAARAEPLITIRSAPARPGEYRRR
jgi:hypothetical protein